jgi:hypothetical protein
MIETHAPRNVIGFVARWSRRLLALAAILTLIGLALMVWSMAEPTPMPVILAMSVGQGLGILAFLLFGVVVLVDQLRKQREAGARDVELSSGVARESASAPPPVASSSPPSREALP